MALKKKKILITAGPTWVAIDDVRVISNIATGTTGALIAAQARKLGLEVTLVCGPCELKICEAAVRVKRFTFFDELRALLRNELHRTRYDIIIHSAAV